MHTCKSIGCSNIAPIGQDFCDGCANTAVGFKAQGLSLSAKYPKYYKSVDTYSEVDVYAVHKIFNIQDPSGAIQHASKKLLLSGVRTGGKSAYDDVREAKDTLLRWLELNELDNL